MITTVKLFPSIAKSSASPNIFVLQNVVEDGKIVRNTS